MRASCTPCEIHTNLRLLRVQFSNPFAAPQSSTIRERFVAVERDSLAAIGRNKRGLQFQRKPLTNQTKPLRTCDSRARTICIIDYLMTAATLLAALACSSAHTRGINSPIATTSNAHRRLVFVPISFKLLPRIRTADSQLHTNPID